MIWAAYATFCESFDRSTGKRVPKLVTPTGGRRAVCLYSMPCLALGSFGVPCCRSVPEPLFGGRFKLPEPRPTWRRVWRLLGISIGWRSEVPQWEPLGACVSFWCFRVGARDLGVNCISSVGFSNRASGCPIYRWNHYGVGFRDPLSLQFDVY